MIGMAGSSQKTAIGFTGEPVPPTMSSGAATNRKLPSQSALTGRAEILELEVVEEVDAHRGYRQHVDRNPTPSVLLGAVSLLPSEPRAATPRSANSGITSPALEVFEQRAELLAGDLLRVGH